MWLQREFQLLATKLAIKLKFLKLYQLVIYKPRNNCKMLATEYDKIWYQLATNLAAFPIAVASHSMTFSSVIRRNLFPQKCSNSRPHCFC